MDLGDWGTVVFRQAPADSFPAPSGRSRQRGAVRAVVEGFGFDIEPWNAKTVEAELRKRGLTPGRRQRRQGIRELSREGSRRLRPSDRQRQRARQSARKSPANAKLSRRRRRSSRLAGKRCGWITSRSAPANYKASVVVLPQPARLGADVRRRQSERADDRRRRRHHHSRRQSARSGLRPRRRARRRRIDHISFGISPWDTDGVKEELEKRGLKRNRYSSRHNVGRHVGARRDPHRRVQELSHGHAERVQPADQLRHA